MTATTAIRPPLPVHDRRPLTVPDRSMRDQFLVTGYHRYFTHRAFTARHGLRVALAVAGGLAAQGPVILWGADDRRHHAFSDRDGDPHSAAVGGLIIWSWWAAVTAVLWPLAIDISARLIWILEKPRWVSDVHWTNPERLARITALPAARRMTP